MEKFSIEKAQNNAEKMGDKIDSGGTEACDEAGEDDTPMGLDVSVENTSGKIAVVRHLDDVDDLFNFGRDGDLIPGQETKVNLIAQEVYSEIKKDNREAAIFICSNMKRAT